MRTKAFPGLTNLGNTCFFNAVLQNISQSCHFRTRLTQLLATNSYQLELKLPESEVSRHLSVTTPHGPLTKALSQLLEQMDAPSGGTVHPGVVLSEVCKQAPRFKGHDQQDSQELLRYLLDSLRTEEINRRKRAILLSFNVNFKPSNDALTENDRRDIKAYGRLAGMAPTFVDEVFAGQLMSSVKCSTCQYRSDIHEDFMDLCVSIPVNEAISNPSYMTRSKNQKKGAETSKTTSPVEKAVVSKSKHQQKKDRQQHHKVGKRHKPTRAGAHESSMATEQAEQKAEEQVNTVATATAQENATCDIGPEDTPPSTTEEAVFASCPTGGTANPNPIEDTAGSNPIEDTAGSNPIGDLSIPNPLGNTASSGVVVEDTAVHRIEDSSVLLSEHHGNLPEAELEEDKMVEKLSSVHLSSIAGVSNGTSDCTNGTEQPSAENGATPDDHILLACLRRFCALELLAGDNKFACPGCHARSKGSSHPGPMSSGPNHPDPLNSGPDHPDPLNSGIDHPDPLNSGPNHPDPLNSGPDHPDPLNSGPDHPDPLNSVPDHPDPLNSGPDHPDPLNSGPDHPDPLNSGPDHPDPLNSVPDHPDPLNSVPDHPDPLNSGPNHPDPLNSGPNHPDPLNSGIDHMSKQLSSIYVYDHLGTPIPAPNSIATADATVATQHLCAVDPSTSRGDDTSDPLPVERTGEENIPVDKEVDQSLPFDGEEDGSLSQSPQGGYQTGDTLARKCARLLDSATLSSEDGEEEGLLSTEISISSTEESKAAAAAKGKDVVYSDLATKQMLVARPPMVLVLCLKRFIHQGKSMRKNNAFISFPLSLDLTPFCTQSCQSQYGRIQYSLYGLVEHAGGMHGGHYVAYINAKRPESGHPSQQKDSTGTSCGVSGHPAPPQRTGDWYYMSDTHVRPASEGEVLKAQAYLLFYERIL
eukprot:Em0023g432a